MAADSKLRRSLGRAGPLGIAVLLGVFLVASSALSYRDSRRTAGIVAERQGIGLIQRVELSLARHRPDVVPADAVRAALEGNRGLGLTYVGVFGPSPGGGTAPLIAEAGTPVLTGTFPAVGRPVIRDGRVRMVNGRLDGPLGPPPGEAPFGRAPPERQPGEAPLAPPRHHRLAIEFEPIASTEAVHRAFAVLLLSIGASLLLCGAAVILVARAVRAERAEEQLVAQRHLAQLGALSAVLAHEIRNPLASLKGHAQLLAERVSDPQLAARVERVVAEAVRLEQLTADLLEFARSGAIRVAPASPRAVLDRAAAATDPARVDVDARRAPAQWPLDADRMHQVLTNLIDNALQVTPLPDRVRVAAAAEAGGLVFTVRDQGPGVVPSERARIFEPFHTTKTRGTGLGLAVAKRIVELHGGRIDVLDPDGAGTGGLFRVYVPATEGSA